MEKEFMTGLQDAINDERHKAFCLVHKLRKAGITTEQLEALARGDAWVAEWVECTYEEDIGRDALTCDDDNGIMLDYYDTAYGFSRIHKMTFNGSHTIPTPKNEGTSETTQSKEEE